MNHLPVPSDDRTWVTLVLPWISREQAELDAAMHSETSTDAQRAAAAAQWRVLEKMRTAPKETLEAAAAAVDQSTVRSSY